MKTKNRQKCRYDNKYDVTWQLVISRDLLLRLNIRSTCHLVCATNRRAWWLPEREINWLRDRYKRTKNRDRQTNRERFFFNFSVRIMWHETKTTTRQLVHFTFMFNHKLILLLMCTNGSRPPVSRQSAFCHASMFCSIRTLLNNLRTWNLITQFSIYIARQLQWKQFSGPIWNDITFLLLAYCIRTRKR